MSLELDDASAPSSGHDDRLARMLIPIIDFLRAAIDGVDALSVTTGDGDAFETVACSEGFALRLDEAQHRRGGPCTIAAWSGEQIYVPDLTTDRRWPTLRQIGGHYGVCSVLSTPLGTPSLPADGNAGPTMVINLYSRARDMFPVSTRRAIAAMVRAAVELVAVKGPERSFF